MAAKLTIQKLNPADQIAIAQISEWYFAEWNTPLEKTRRRLRQPSEKTTLFQITLSLNTELIATGGLANEVNIFKVHPQFNTLGPWIALLYTAPAHRGQGYGQKLLEAIEQEAQAAGIEQLYLYTYTAEAFYRRSGWTPIDRVIYKNQDTVVMKKHWQASRPKN